MSTTDYPRTYGQTERINRVIGDILRGVCADAPKWWSSILFVVHLALNNTVHASTGFTSFHNNGLTHPCVALTLPLRSSGLGGKDRR